MEKKIKDKLKNFLEKDIFFTLKKDFKWLSKIITKDLEKLTKDKKISKKKND